MLGQVQDAAEDAVESTLHMASASNNSDNDIMGGDPHNPEYVPTNETFYGQPRPGLHGNRRPVGAYNHASANMTANIGNWPRALGVQGEHAIFR